MYTMLDKKEILVKEKRTVLDVYLNFIQFVPHGI